MNPEKIYVEVPGELGWRRYNINELVALWCAAQLPPNAKYQDDAGQWRAVAELVEPIIKRNTRGPAEGRTTMDRGSQRLGYRPVWLGASIVILIVALCLWPLLQGRHRGHSGNQQSDEGDIEWQRAGQVEDAIKSGQVTLGMTAEQVRRSWGEPKSRKGTPDSTNQQWIYRHRTVIFENGVVTRVETKGSIDPR